jgi:hypothetical protein
MSVRKTSFLVLALALIGWAARADWRAAAPAPAADSTVLVELFTSEGCSSCPPADDVLSDLMRRQPVAGVHVLALSEHVDYWDRLGWRDPYSSEQFSSRQTNYDDRVFHANQVYTPQLVVDGRYEQVGSDLKAVLRAITHAAQAPKATVAVTVARAGAKRDLDLALNVNAPPALTLHDAVDVVVAVTEDNLTTSVARGENGGRILRHTGVVRALTTIATLTGRTWSGRASVPWQSAWKAGDVRVTAFLQERSSRHIVGAGVATLDDHSSMK